MNISTKRTMLGDWDSNQYSTRASDWMTEHMNVFYEYTNDSFWLDAKDTVYDLIFSIDNNYSTTTGLMPDFVVDNSPKPASAYFLEGPNDGSYYYNSCRFPWRIAMDFLFYNEPRAKERINKLINWLKTKTNNDPNNIIAGYDLSGNDLSGSNYFTTAFVAPFIAACTVDSQHQEYLNAGWDTIKDYKESYYEDNINLLCQLYISGKWWKPGSGNSSSSSSSSSSSISSSSSSSVSSSSSISSSISSSSSSSQGNYITVLIPHVYDGSGEYYWKTSTISNYINSWNLELLEINGEDLTNMWKGGQDLSAKIDGYYYIHYKGQFGWSHFEAK